MRVTRIGSAVFYMCSFENSDLGYCSAEETSFEGSTIRSTSLDNVTLVKTDFTDATLDSVSVYGISAWDLTLERTDQNNLVVGGASGSVSVDNIEVAQFIYLLIHNSKLRSVIDTITSRVVLILGRFTRDRKKALNRLRRELTSAGYVPVVFDFAGPESRDVSETVGILAHLARFVIADLTDPRSVPHELTLIVPQLPSVPLQPIILEGQQPFCMFAHFERYPWVLPVLKYDESDMVGLGKEIAARAEAALRS